MTFSLSPINVKDASGNSQSMAAYTDGTNKAFAHAVLDSTGALINPATSGKQDTANTALGAPADTAETDPASSGSIIAFLKGILTSVLNIPAKGSANAANSLPVVIASDQTVPVSQAANTSGGSSVFCANGIAGGNELLTEAPQTIKGSAGNLYGVNFKNADSVDAYVQIYDAASPTVGTDVPKLCIWVPAGGSWAEKFTGESKISFGTAITIAATTTATGNTGSAGVIANVVYK